MKPLPIKEVIQLVGGQEKLAAICGKTQPTISYWLKRDIPLAGEYVIDVVRAINGAKTKEQIRPDIFTPSEAA